MGERSPHAGTVAAELFLLWLAALAVRLRRFVPEDVFLLNATAGRSLGAAALATLGAALLASEFDQGCARVLEALAWEPPLLFDYLLVRTQLITDPTSGLTILLAVILVPALCEEAFFRGFVFTGLRYHIGPRAAVVGSALLFAAAHFNPWQFPALFLLGLFLSALVHWTHSLYPAMLAHAVNNALSVVAVNLRVYTGWDGLGAAEPLPVVVLLAAGVALVAGIRWLRRSSPIMPILSPYSRPAPADGPAAAWR
ncbi:MAG TPA: CPBP family intramembrane glutamic endopeptidase [Candidatus Latescibacteria bacterium]|nr:CPBP family intramembrane glutamic endopeptidase [Candidatus Latescibacterota bacterium]